MPSEFEPGGIVQVFECLFSHVLKALVWLCLILLQHEFFSAGTPVIAFATGGLKDSVVQVIVKPMLSKHVCLFMWSILQYNKANCRGNGCVFTVHDFAGIKWSVDTAIEFHEDRSAYAQLRCNAWDSVIDLEEVKKKFADSASYLFLKTMAGVRCIYPRVRRPRVRPTLIISRSFQVPQASVQISSCRITWSCSWWTATICLDHAWAAQRRSGKYSRFIQHDPRCFQFFGTSKLFHHLILCPLESHYNLVQSIISTVFSRSGSVIL